MSLPRLYTELADWWHLLSAPADYAEEAGIFMQVFEEHARRPIRTMLELGSGGGNNASHMKARYELTLTDLSPRMLEQSERINPECEHIQGDMRTIRLNRTFDAVFVHDAVAYMLTEEDLGAAVRTAYEHLDPDGIALIVPDDTAESIVRSANEGGHDSGERSLRYVYIEELPEPGQTLARASFTYRLREGDSERVETEVHEFGVFPRATWLRLFTDVGFEPTVASYDHSEFRAPQEMFVGIRTP